MNELTVDGHSHSFRLSPLDDDTARTNRSKRKHSEPSTCCPVCSITVRPSEMSAHLTAEVEKLDKLSAPKKNGTPSAAPLGTAAPANGHHHHHHHPPPANTHWETYQRVKSNRTGRQRVKSRKRKPDPVVCPICYKETSEDIQLHVDVCLRRAETNQDAHVDVEGETEYEEYEWAGHSRVRATTLLEGGVLGLGTSISMVAEDDEDLVVDGDDAHVYGSPQYCERDVIVPGGDKEREALRQAVIGADGERAEEEGGAQVPSEAAMDVRGDPVVNALKSRIRELETRDARGEDAYKCLICMERYQTPVISVCCWHVHCERCWLQTLGAKKLCPQCNMITSPADLRRIYM